MSITKNGRVYVLRAYMNMTPGEIKPFMWAAFIWGVYCHRRAAHIFGEVGSVLNTVRR